MQKPARSKGKGSMRIQVLFFGATAGVIGRRRLELDVADAAKADAVFEQLLAEYPQLAAHKLLYSINRDYATGDEIVSEGDELAVFTAVSGG